VHFGVGFSNSARFGLNAIKVVIYPFHGVWLIEKYAKFQSYFTIM
jgi:hypothetical protein